MLAYLKRAVIAARSKLTTYVSGSTALIAMVPDFAQNQWGQLEQEIPRLHTYHHAVVVAGILATIWTRIRREAKGP